MREPPPRKRLQIHLSTAIVMMFVAGGLIWGNVTPRRYDMNCTLYSKMPDVSVPTVCYGWPMALYFIVKREVIPEGYVPHNIGEFAPLHKAANGNYYYIDLVFLLGFPFNAFIATTILFATWFLCECLMRRRVLRKGR